MRYYIYVQYPFQNILFPCLQIESQVAAAVATAYIIRYEYSNIHIQTRLKNIPMIKTKISSLLMYFIFCDNFTYLQKFYTSSIHGLLNNTESGQKPLLKKLIWTATRKVG